MAWIFLIRWSATSPFALNASVIEWTRQKYSQNVRVERRSSISSASWGWPDQQGSELKKYSLSGKNWAVKSDSWLLCSIPWRPRFFLQFWFLEISNWGRRCLWRKEWWQIPEGSLKTNIIWCVPRFWLTAQICYRSRFMCSNWQSASILRVGFYMAPYFEEQK